ncbi:MAG: leucine-rich repeat protein [Bacteroidales bacterium]|nr:leucine-rich repeat protein [Bacteroidales bacterium]
MMKISKGIISSRMFANRDDLVEVVIPEGIIRIEKDAFIGCSNLQKVVLPDSVTEIECWGDDKHSYSSTLFSPFTDLPQYLKEGREVDLYPDHWR